MMRGMLASRGMALGLVLSSACAQEARLVPLDAAVPQDGTAGSAGVAGAAGAAGSGGIAGAAGGADAGDSSAGGTSVGGASGQGGAGGQGGGSQDAGEDVSEADVAPVCATGKAECDGNWADPCETNLESDSGHCGACQHSCEGGACQGGACTPETLYSGESQVAALAVDGADVYWTITTTAGSVKRAPKDGGGAVSTLVSSLMYPANLTVDGTWVFYGGGSGNTGYLTRMNKSGGGTLTLCPKSGVCTDPFDSPEGLVMDAGGLYWATSDPFEMDPGRVQRINKDGLGFSSLATATDKKSPYSYVAVDDDGVYVADSIKLGIWKLKKTSSLTPELIVSGVNGIRQLQAPGGDRIFYSSVLLSDFTLWSYSKTAKSSMEVMKRTGMGLSSLIADAQHVFACDQVGGAVYRMNHDGSGQVTIGTGTAEYGCAAQDDKYLYLRSSSQGVIARLPK